MKKSALCLPLIIIALSPLSARDFWSPREVALDTYDRPIPFQLGDSVCLAYELHITNMDIYPISLKSITVFADGLGGPLIAYSGELLKESLTRIAVPGGMDSIDIVNKGQRAILHVLLGFKNKDKIPTSLSHQVVYSFLREGGSEVETTTRGGTIDVAVDTKALIIGSPVRKGIWMAARGVDEGLSGHREGVIRPEGGTPHQKARYAFDFTRLNEKGNPLQGDMSQCASWYAYGSEVIAVADAYVETVQDGIPDSRPNDPNRLDNLTGSTLAGNYIILDLGSDLFALYGHLKPGSIPVKRGEAVKKGQVIGLVGNSGNSTIPHLHFQVNRHTPIKGEPIPYVLEKFELVATIDVVAVFRSVQAKNIVDGVGRGIIERMSQRRSAPRPSGDNSTVSVEASVEASILGQMLNSIERDPKLDLNLGRTGEIRTLEMPSSGSVIRF